MQKDNTIHDELKSISPLLSEWHARDSIKKMEKGFEDKADEFIYTLSQLDHQFPGKGISLPAGISYKSCFKVPENYFSANADVIFSQINQQKNHIALISLNSFRKWAIAASILFILGIGVYKFGFLKGTVNPVACVELSCRMAQLPEGELVSYLEESGIDVDAAVLASLGDDNDLPADEELLLDNQIITKEILKSYTN